MVPGQEQVVFTKGVGPGAMKADPFVVEDAWRGTAPRRRPVAACFALPDASRDQICCDEQGKENQKREEKQYLGNLCSRSGYSRETEDPRDQRYREEYECPLQHAVTSF